MYTYYNKTSQAYKFKLNFCFDMNFFNDETMVEYVLLLLCKWCLHNKCATKINIAIILCMQWAIDIWFFLYILHACHSVIKNDNIYFICISNSIYNVYILCIVYIVSIICLVINVLWCPWLQSHLSWSNLWSLDFYLVN